MLKVTRNNQIAYLKAMRKHYRERQDIADKYGEVEDVERDEEVIQRCTMEIYKLGGRDGKKV